ncbi:MAG: GDP-mannose 4,6-dehydratase [Endomicrobia bacterium]|nr:GDP-mannose 4,6-dehydratase [Endomicrobiia bacterium]
MKVLVTGSCGFIGTNVCLFHLKRGDEVVGIDNLSRRGTEFNLQVLKNYSKFRFYKVDIRDLKAINKIFKLHQNFSIIYHLAAQVAVTLSVENPIEDFEVNILGTLNLLEATRRYQPKAFFIFASTNKVYGGMEHIQIKLKDDKYFAVKYPNGIDENFNLDFHSPYGCSKGAADQYVRDYARIYGLNTVVFRQSCIYGPYQFGIEDQGWVAYFCIQALLDKPITIYGDGRQVRDVLYIDDLIEAYWLAYKKRKKVLGEIFNIGGGKENIVGILEFIKYLEEKLGKKILYKFAPWRPGDQKYFVSDNTKLKKLLSWQPKISFEEGVEKLLLWIKQNKCLIDRVIK